MQTADATSAVAIAPATAAASTCSDARTTVDAAAVVAAAATDRIFQISDKLFWGYRMRVDLMYVDDIDAVVKIMKLDMKKFFIEHNLLELADKSQALQLHCHANSQSIRAILYETAPGDIIYLCGDCCKDSAAGISSTASCCG